MLSSVMKLKSVIIFTDHAVIFHLKIAQMITIVNTQWIGDGLSVLERLSHNWDYLDGARLGQRRGRDLGRSRDKMNER